jgi:uncharacterized heparinase superfamily protein
MDRLSSALRFFTLSDGRLCSFQGGETVEADRIAAATSQEDNDSQPSRHAPHVGYHRATGPTLQVMVDAAPPARDAWSVAACAQPLAMAVVCGPDAIFCNTGWSPDAAAPVQRLTAAGGTAQLEYRSTAKPLTGWLADILGPRLVGGPSIVEVRRDDNEVGSWLELAHDGWIPRFSVIHERRIYIDATSDEMRGEDAFPVAPGKSLTRPIPFSVRFHLHPDVQVSIAKDGRSVLLRGPSNRGWWFRNDASLVALEPSVHFERGVPRRAVQVVLKGEIRPGLSARIRWKLTPVDPAPPKTPRARAKAAPKPVADPAPEPPIAVPVLDTTPPGDAPAAEPSDETPFL